MSGPIRVDIHYERPPDREEVFSQLLLLDDDTLKVTLATNLVFEPPLRIGGQVALETGSAAVWFTFPGRWHDIGLFHRADETFTGTYANILTPPTFETSRTWRTTDLFLDVWVSPQGELEVLDLDQFDTARADGVLDAELASGALAELDRIVGDHAAGRWPPTAVAEWPLERAMRVARDPGLPR